MLNAPQNDLAYIFLKKIWEKKNNKCKCVCKVPHQAGNSGIHEYYSKTKITFHKIVIIFK